MLPCQHDTPTHRVPAVKCGFYFQQSKKHAAMPSNNCDHAHCFLHDHAPGYATHIDAQWNEAFDNIRELSGHFHCHMFSEVSFYQFMTTLE